MRFGAAITQARPRMDDLGGGSGFNVTPDSGTPTQGPNGELYYWTSNDGGNPELRPWEANTFDLSWEKYFGDNQGYFSLAAYYKDLTTYIVNETIIVDYDGLRPAIARERLRPGQCEPPRCADGQGERQWRLDQGLRGDVVAAVRASSRRRSTASASS